MAESRNEVDAVQWVSVEEALARLTYERDHALLTAFTTPARRSRYAAP